MTQLNEVFCPCHLGEPTKKWADADMDFQYEASIDQGKLNMTLCVIYQNCHSWIHYQSNQLISHLQIGCILTMHYICLRVKDNDDKFWGRKNTIKKKNLKKRRHKYKTNRCYCLVSALQCILVFLLPQQILPANIQNKHESTTYEIGKMSLVRWKHGHILNQ